jgi:molybdopterin converting factor small subunit
MLAANLRKYVPGYDAETGYQTSIDAGSTISDLVRQLRIPEQEVKLLMVNGVAAKWDTVLAGDERVALFPPVGGG